MRVALPDERDVDRLAGELGRGLDPLGVDVLGVERQAAVADDCKSALLDVLGQRLVARRVTLRVRDFAGPEEEDVLLDPRAALARRDVEGPAHLQVNRGQRGRHRCANAQRAYGEGRIGARGDEDLRVRVSGREHQRGEQRRPQHRSHQPKVLGQVASQTRPEGASFA
jgi:hypothetical protein